MASESMVEGPEELEQGWGCRSRVREADRRAKVREMGKLRFAEECGATGLRS